MLFNVLGFCLGRYYQKNEVAQQLLWNQKEEVITSPKKITDDISNWKTYRNDEYGFEFRYPPTLFYEECALYSYTVRCLSFFSIGSTPMFSQGGHDGNEYFSVYVQTDSKSLELYKDELLGNPSNSSVPLYINTLSGYKISSESTNHYLFQGTNKYLYSIFTRNLNSNSSINQILSTFRFIDDSQIQEAEL